MSVYRSLIRWVGDRPWFRPVARWVLPPIDRALLRFAGWRATPFPTLLLTTAGHRVGGMLFRWIGAEEHPPVEARVVPFRELRGL